MRADLIERLRNVRAWASAHAVHALCNEAADALEASLQSGSAGEVAVNLLEWGEWNEAKTPFGKYHAYPDGDVHFTGCSWADRTDDPDSKAGAQAIHDAAVRLCVATPAKAAGGWRLIDGDDPAPRDGTRLWLYWPSNYADDRQSVGWWEKNLDGDHWIDNADSDWNGQPSHWMHLPTSPSPDGERQPEGDAA